MPDPVGTFADDVGTALSTIYGAAAEDVNQSDLSFDYLDEQARKYGEERGAEMIGMRRLEDKSLVENPNAEWVISKTTREETEKLLQRAMDEGWSPQKFADALEEAGLYGEARAEMIARSEVAIAQNYGQVETYRELGFSEVYVYDGDEDPECAEADGATWPLEQALDNPIAHPNAIFAGTEVLTLGWAEVGYKARWSGPAIRIATAMGNVLTVSANHPVLTGRGWVPAHEVHVGDKVISGPDAYAVGYPTDLNLQKTPSMVEEIFDALAANGASSRCAAAPAHFHGDGNFCEGDVHVVGADCLLSGEWNAPFLKEGHELIFAPAGMELEPLPREGALELRGEAVALPPASGVSLGDVRRIGVARAQDYPALLEPVSEDVVADSGFMGEMQRRFALSVSLDEVVEVGDVDPFVGHAFDLTTGFRAYFANGILIHNCVRSFSPVEMN